MQAYLLGLLLTSLAVAGCSAGGGGPSGGPLSGTSLSRAEADRITADMERDPLLEAPPGSKIVSTARDPCGEGSVAPTTRRVLLGVPKEGVDAYYTAQLRSLGWTDIRNAPAGGLGASKGVRTAYVGNALKGEWTVLIQHGKQVAGC